MQIDYLRYFIALNQYESINKTSRMLNTTPQNVSRILKQMETELDIDLFFRTPQGIIITSYGKSFLEFAKNTISQYDAIQSEFKFLKTESLKENSITLFSHRFINEIFLNDLLVEFFQKYPDISINNIITDYQDGYNQLLENPTAIGCFYDDALHQYIDTIPNTYEKTSFYNTTPVVAVSKNHPFTKKTNISIRDFIGEKIAIYTIKGDVKDTLQYSLLENFKITDQVSYITSSSLRVCYGLASTSDYLFPVSLESFQNQDSSITKNLVTIPYSDFPPAQQYLIRPRTLSPENSAQQLFCSFLLNYIQEKRSAALKE